MLVFGFMEFGQVENYMTSIERVMTYSKLEPEPGYHVTTQPPDTWPQQGAIQVEDMSLRYVEGGATVLRGLSFSIQAKEKVGVAGRTGAGKSSMVAALFRMPQPTGSILIDGVDTASLSVQSVRRAMAVITQDPVLFGGSLRKNLDPFSQFSDADLWTALEEVQLKGLVEKLPGQLEFQVRESGSNFSVGERQLLCLARALLRRSKILIMDEATANVDYKTDRLIQQVIRQKFGDCTVLTIAHRVNTIIDYDKVLVLDDGCVVEFGKPEALLAKDNVFLARSEEKREPEQSRQQSHR